MVNFIPPCMSDAFIFMWNALKIVKINVTYKAVEAAWAYLSLRVDVR